MFWYVLFKMVVPRGATLMFSYDLFKLVVPQGATFFGKLTNGFGGEPNNLTYIWRLI